MVLHSALGLACAVHPGWGPGPITPHNLVVVPTTQGCGILQVNSGARAHSPGKASVVDDTQTSVSARFPHI